VLADLDRRPAPAGGHGRNGFFGHVTGQLLFGKPFTDSTGEARVDGRPIVLNDGKGCIPDMGRRSFMPPSFDPCCTSSS
jgi:hypothetical protein